MASLDNNVIICNDVHKWYGEYHALRGVTTTVKEGEVVVIIGPSGSGKSTWIRTINRLEEHQKGQIIVDGTELNNDIRHIQEIRREVGMVFQQFNLFPHLTVLQNVTLGGTGKSDEDRHPKIGNGVLIGAGAKVLGNIKVGDCSRIGAGSVVLKEVPPRVTVAGVPAKVIGAAGCAQPALVMDQMITVYDRDGES